MSAPRKKGKGTEAPAPAEEVRYTAAEVEQIVQERVAALRRELVDLTPADSERKHMEEAFWESEEKTYRSLGIQPPQTLVLMQDGRIVFVNRWAVEYGGYSEEELLAMSPEEVLQLFHPGDRPMIARCIRERLVRTDAPVRHEVRFIRRDGTVIWGDVFVNLVQHKGRAAYQILFVDITERKRVEAALHEHIEIERALLNIPTDLSTLLDTEGIILDINEPYAQMLGKSPQELIGNTIWPFFQPDVYAWRRKLFDEALASRKLVRVERKQNNRWYDIVVNPIFTEEGTIIRVAVIVRDITDRKRVEEALRESEERFRSILDNSLDALYRRNLVTGRFEYCSPAVESVTGLSAREEAAMSVDALLKRVHPEDRPRVLAEKMNVPPMVTQGTVDYRLLHKDGTYRWVSERFRITYDAEGRPLVREGILRDITERKHTEEVLRESEEKARMIIHSSRDGILLNDAEGVIVEWNPAMERITGIPKEQTAGHTLLQAASWLLLNGGGQIEDVEQRLFAMIDQLDQPAPEPSQIPLVELTIRHADGTPRCIQAQSFMFTSSGGVLYGAVIRDITEQKQAQETLVEREEQLRNLIESSGDGILITDEAGRITTWNKGMEAISGLAARDALGMPAWEVQSRSVDEAWAGTDHKRRFRALWDRLLRNGGQYPDRLLEVQIRTPQGELRYLQHMVFSIPTQRGYRIGCIMRDVTENKRAELQLKDYAENLRRSNEDLELFAQIATHDLQEPIRGIVTFSQILLDQCRAGIPPTEKYLQNIEEAGLRMHRLVADLRRYSGVRAHEKPLEPTDMESILDSALNNLQLAIKETGASITHDPLPTALADGTQMIQVFQNLIDNAIKFRREGISPVIHVSASPGDGMWRFSIQDNGIGMNREYFDRIFVLFERLHRRDAYPGTGLGLALCRRIVDRHGGKIWVESEPGKGSTFYFTLMPAA